MLLLTLLAMKQNSSQESTLRSTEEDVFEHETWRFDGVCILHIHKQNSYSKTLFSSTIDDIARGGLVPLGELNCMTISVRVNDCLATSPGEF